MSLWILWVWVCVIHVLLLWHLTILGSSPSSPSLLLILLADDKSARLLRVHRSLDNAPPRRLLSPCPQGSVSPVSSAASPPGAGVPWSPPGRKCYPGTTLGTGTMPSRRHPSPQTACWNTPCWSSAALSGCWPCRGATARLHSDCDLEEERQGHKNVLKVGTKFNLWF